MRLLSIAVALCLTACSTLPLSRNAEFRAGLALYNDPKFSFQIPDGWRPATAEDWLRFGANQRVLSIMTDQGRRDFQRIGAEELAKYPMVLISARGAWINVTFAPNKGVRYPAGYVLNDAEKKNIWQAVESALLKDSPPTDRPVLTMRSVDVTEFGGNVALRLRFLREDRRGVFTWTVLAFYGDRHVVPVAHVGVPENEDEGIEGLEVIGRTFKCE
jgi:hypothetical protein